MEERDWESLPYEIVRKILSHLYFGDVSNFRSVCKRWNWVANLPISPVESPASASPWLMFSPQYNTNFHFYNPLYKRICDIDIPELSGVILRYSKDGWLLISRGESCVFFFNPFTKKKINLPDFPMPYGYCCNGICFTSDPTASDCTVLGALCHTPMDTFLFFIRRGEEKWNFHHFEHEEDMYEPANCNPVFHNGAFYVLGRDRKLGVFDLKGCERVHYQPRCLAEPVDEHYAVDCDTRIVTLSQYLANPVDECYMVECDGKLVSVFIQGNGEKVLIYWLDESNMTWKIVKNLGNNVLFVSHCCSIVMEKEVAGMENKIFFPRFYDGDGIFYCLESKRFGTFSNNFSSKCLYNTKEQLHCVWMEPNLTCASEALSSWNFSDNTSDTHLGLIEKFNHVSLGNN